MLECHHKHSNKKVAIDPIFRLNKIARKDPTRTLTLRRAYIQAMEKRFNHLKSDIVTSIVDNDCFGLTPRPHQFKVYQPIPERSFEFLNNPRKIKEFMRWIREQEERGILEITMREGRDVISHSEWQNLYIQHSYKKGMRDAAVTMRKAKVIDPNLAEARLIEASFLRPIHADAAAMLYTRAFDELTGVTSAMDQALSRTLTDGLIAGHSPTTIARSIVKNVENIGIVRARTIARTEIIRAHAEATLNMFERAGLAHVTVLAEWVTAGFGVCPDCQDMEGLTFTINEARGMIPLHPNCRCTWIPVIVK